MTTEQQQIFVLPFRDAVTAFKMFALIQPAKVGGYKTWIYKNGNGPMKNLSTRCDLIRFAFRSFTTIGGYKSKSDALI
jgi:hypothetical protein